MSMVINTNMGAENANRILAQTGKEQSTIMERLTTGKQINSSADNAAGLAITTGMTSQITGTDQSIRNANNGVSMIQTLDGSSEEVVNMLQRMRELSVQSLNGAFTADNRNQMDTEYNQLMTEIDRVAVTTKFNEVQVMQNVNASGVALSAAQNNINIHVGWETGSDNKIAISLGNFNTGLSGAGGGGNMFGTFTHFSSRVAGGAQVAISVRASSFSATNIATQAGASVAVMKIDGALSNISDLRSKWGALQNRMESTVSNLSNVNENIMAAKSQIESADFAKESANLARTQVLQQAGMSMLSQANQQSQNVMTLLR